MSLICQPTSEDIKHHFIIIIIIIDPADEDQNIMTYIGHDSQDYITVNGYQDPGSYVRMIKYATHSMEAIEDIIERADSCRQYIEYRCCLLYTSPSPRDISGSRMPSSA